MHLSLPVLDRYLVSELFKTLFGVIAVLMVILVSNRLVRYLADAASGEISSHLVFHMLGLKSLGYFGLLVPPAYFIAILLTLGRMYRDYEMTALSSCGVSTMRMYKAIFYLSVPLSVFAAYMTLAVMPWANEQLELLKQDQSQSTEIQGLKEGAFNELRDGELIFYVGSLSSENNELDDVFIETTREERTAVIAAESGTQGIDPNTGRRYLILKDGTRYEGEPGKGRYQVAEYSTYGIYLDEPEPVKIIQLRSAIASSDLWGSDNLADQAEIHWRMATPISILILTLLAVPLSRVDPRRGRYGQLMIAVLIYVIYSNLLGVGQNWMMRSQTPEWLGLWWVHMTFLAMFFIVLARSLGVRWLWMVITRRGPASL